MNELGARFDLPAGVEAPAVARQAAGSMLYGWGYRDRQWTQLAMLIVSELVTNSVQHAGGCLSLDVQARGATVTIGATDGSAAVPSRRDADDAGGRGLMLIEAVSGGWGVQKRPGGKRVWVRLAPYPHAAHH